MTIKTIKDVIKFLKKRYKYVRFIELEHRLRLENNPFWFKNCLICSDFLEEYSTIQEEIDNISIKVYLSNVECRFFTMINTVSGKHIPLFEIITVNRKGGII